MNQQKVSFQDNLFRVKIINISHNKKQNLTLNI